MAFEDLDQFFDDGLDLPVGGRVWRIPAPDAELGLWCQRLIAAGYAAATGQDPTAMPKMPQLELDDEGEHALYRRLLGATWDEMVAAGVSWPKLQIVGTTVLLWVGGSIEMAEAYWRSGGDPNSIAPSRSMRRGGSKSTAMAGTTKRPGSTSGTKSRPAKRAASPASPSRGNGS